MCTYVGDIASIRPPIYLRVWIDNRNLQPKGRSHACEFVTEACRLQTRVRVEFRGETQVRYMTVGVGWGREGG